MSDNKLPYSTDLVETKTINEFLSDEQVAKLVKFYDSATESLANLTNKKIRIPEITFHPEFPPEATEYVTLDDDPNNACRLGEYIDLESDNEIYNDFIESLDKTVVEEFPDIIKKKLKEQGYNDFKFTKISLQNLNEYNHVTQCKGNSSKKIDKILSKPEKNIHAFQGTVALDLDNEKYSTAIFNQWFPYSTYYMTNYSEETTPWKKRIDMSFLENHAPMRFNESIRNHTGKEFSEANWNNINEYWIRECDWHSFDKKQFYGLSLDRVVLFGNPGTLNLWDCKKYYISMPWNATFGTRRLTLNFETKNT